MDGCLNGWMYACMHEYMADWMDWIEQLDWLQSIKTN
jgi:hypothetical protein